MKFIIKKEIILRELTNVSRAISTKNIIPVLNGIVFELTKDGLYLTASDTELIIKSFIDKKEIEKIEETGTMIIPSKYILEIIRKMEEDVISFQKLDTEKIQISNSNNEYNLNCLNPSDYPSISFEESDKKLLLKADDIKEMISQTSFAISNQESRPLLTGVNINIVGDVLECTATDSYRLAKKSIKINNKTEDNYNFIIPGRNIIEISKILENENELELHIFTNKILIKYNNIMIISNLLNGTYPNTNNLIPTDFEIIVKVKLNELYNAIDRASLLTQVIDKNAVKLSIEKNILLISSFASETGRSEEKITLEQDSSKSINISFSAKFMLDALKTIKEDEVLLLLNSDIKPIVLKGITDDSIIQLLLPIKTY